MPEHNFEFTLIYSSFATKFAGCVSEPVICPCEYTFDWGVMKSPTLQFDPVIFETSNIRVINIISRLESLDLVQGVRGKNFEVKVTARVAGSESLQFEQVFNFLIKNPCFDEQYVVFYPAPFQEQQYDYFITDPPLQFNHEYISYGVYPIDHDFCGTVVYETTFDSVSLSTTTEPMQYDGESKQFTI